MLRKNIEQKKKINKQKKKKENKGGGGRREEVEEEYRICLESFHLCFGELLNEHRRWERPSAEGLEERDGECVWRPSAAAQTHIPAEDGERDAVQIATAGAVNPTS